MRAQRRHHVRQFRAEVIVHHAGDLAGLAMCASKIRWQRQHVLALPNLVECRTECFTDFSIRDFRIGATSGEISRHNRNPFGAACRRIFRLGIFFAASWQIRSVNAIGALLHRYLVSANAFSCQFLTYT